MKKYLYISFLITIVNSFGQTASTFVPKINNLPTSPEAALLGRFGDIPVGYYTGSANISIPLYTIEESGVQVPIVLNYNATGIKVADEATWVGLGWSLDPGGYIMQEVRGRDDQYDSFYWPNPLGTSGTEWQTFKDHYAPIGTVHYQTGECNKQPVETWRGTICNNLSDPGSVISALLEGNGQPDIYNYNLPGYSGKYYIDPETDQLILLDKKQQLSIQGTTITTPEGNVFTFAAEETTQGANTSISNVSGRTNKLSDISLANGRNISFSYASENHIQWFSRSSVTLNPYEQGSTGTPQNYTDYSTGNKKRLTQITTEDIYINFIAEAREDFLNDGNNNLQRLKQIDIISRITGKKIKSFLFNYSYFNPNSDYHSKRLKLDSVKEIGYDADENADTSKPPYLFTYDTSIMLPSKESKAVDFWGYYNGSTGNTSFIPDLRYFEYEHDPRYMYANQVVYTYNYLGANRFPNNSYAKAYMLTKVTYPTKGYTEFEFEPHTFDNQFIPNRDQLLTSAVNVSRWKRESCCNAESNPYNFTITKSQTIRFNPSFSHGFPLNANINAINAIYYNAYIKLTKTINGTATTVKEWRPYQYMTYTEFESSGFAGETEYVWIPYEAGALYTLTVSFPTYTYTPNPNYPYSIAQSYVSMTYYNNNLIDATKSVCGGFRIKTVKNYTDSGILASHKQINYYEGKLLNLFEPIALINVVYNNRVSGQGHPSTWPTYSVFRTRLSISSDDLGIEGGNPIGYGKVEEIELANNGTDNIGLKTFNYINNVNQNWKGYPKDLSIINGLIIKEEIRNKDLTKLYEKSYQYQSLPTGPVGYGIKINTHIYGNYDWYGSTQGNDPLAMSPFDYKYSFGRYPITAKWNVLQSSTTKEYFNGSEIASTEAYTYNANGHLKTTTTTYATGEQTSTALYYPGEVSGAPASEAQMLTAKMMGIPLYTEHYKNSQLLSFQKLEYINDATTASHMLPKYIYHKKGNISGASPNRRITFDKYDDKGNLLQYTLENGTPVCYIWGYNKTMPIAKIENASYASFNSTVNNLIMSAQSNSNSNNESALITNLNSIRTNLPNAMVTTYTFRPGVGVSTITDPKGDKITYTYDNFGRLVSVKDKNGKLLSENSYNYRP